MFQTTNQHNIVNTDFEKEKAYSKPTLRWTAEGSQLSLEPPAVVCQQYTGEPGFTQLSATIPGRANRSGQGLDPEA
jgi:hypothetical protein